MMIYFCLHTSIDHTGLIGPRQGHTPTYWSVICFRSKHWSYSCSHSPVPWFCPAVLAWLTTTHCVTNALNLMKWGRSGNASILLPVAFCNRIQMWWCLCTHKIWKLDHHYRLKKSARRGWRIRSKVPTNTIPHMYTEIYSIYIYICWGDSWGFERNKRRKWMEMILTWFQKQDLVLNMWSHPSFLYFLITCTVCLCSKFCNLFNKVRTHYSKRIRSMYWKFPTTMSPCGSTTPRFSARRAPLPLLAFC